MANGLKEIIEAIFQFSLNFIDILHSFSFKFIPNFHNSSSLVLRKLLIFTNMVRFVKAKFGNVDGLD